MLPAEEIMTWDVITVKEDTSIREAMEIMLKKQVSGVPVVSDDMNLAGILSEKDVVALFYDKEGRKTKKVRDFMSEQVLSFDIEDNLIDICDFLAKGLVRRVPITSKGKLVGIVSIPDLIKYALTL